MKAIIQSQILKKTTKILAGKNIKVYTEGFAPRVEYNSVTKQPSAVYIPEVPEGASHELLGAMQGYIDHECGHILESSNEDICDSSKNQLWHYIHNCIEDPRVNEKMAERFPGCEHNIRNGYNYIFNKEEDVAKNPYAVEYVDAIDLKNEKMVKDQQVNYSSLWFAKKANCRFSSRKYDELDLDRLFDPLEKKMNPRYLDALSRCGTTEEVKEATDYFVDFFHKEFDDSKSPAGGPGKGDPSKAKHDKNSRLGDPKKMEDKLSDAILEEIEHLAKESKENWYWTDRFDYVATKFDIAKGLDSSKISSFESKTKMVTNYLTKDLRRLLEARNRRWYTGGFKSGRLNQKALASVKVGNDRIFSRKSEIRDVKAAVSLLIDLSGSMRGPRDEPKAKVAIQAAYAFAMVLEQLKVPYEVWGFCTEAHNIAPKSEAWREFAKKIDANLLAKVVNPLCPDWMFAFKQFGENFDVVSKAGMIRAAELQVKMENNEDSRHVKAALERLAIRPEELKTLFVFSDGMPQFAPGDNRVSQEMLKHLVDVSKSRYGVDIYGIGIQSEAVKHYYKNYKVVKDLQELPAALFEFLRTRI